MKCSPYAHNDLSEPQCDKSNHEKRKKWTNYTRNAHCAYNDCLELFLAVLEIDDDKIMKDPLERIRDLTFGTVRRAYPASNLYSEINEKIVSDNIDEQTGTSGSIRQLLSLQREKYGVPRRPPIKKGSVTRSAPTNQNNLEDGPMRRLQQRKQRRH